MRTGIPSFLITLGTFFVLQGVNLGVTKLVTGSVSTPNINQMDGYDSLQRDLRVELSDRRGHDLDRRHLVVPLRGARRVDPQRTRVGNWIFAVGATPPVPEPSVSP